MSRIHEALRKAEQDRAGTASPADPSGAPLAPGAGTPAPAWVEAMSAVASGVLTETKRVPSAREDGVLQFSYIVEHCAHPGWCPNPSTNVFHNSELNVGGAEQFRTLRSRLYQLGNDRPLKTLLVTSSVPGEGKTFVTSNLGLAVVRQHERRALLIDADLRCSRLHVPLCAPSSPGLSDYLRGDADLLSVIQCGQDDNLCLIPGGSAVENPSELLANGRFKILLDRVAPAFDWILIDSPPCLPVADASMLGELCDGLLLVVKARSTRAALLAKAGRELQERNVVGVVMNQVDERAFGYNSYYSYGYQTGSGDSKE